MKNRYRDRQTHTKGVPGLKWVEKGGSKTPAVGVTQKMSLPTFFVKNQFVFSKINNKYIDNIEKVFSVLTPLLNFVQPLEEKITS